MPPRPSSPPDAFLPLPVAEFHILISLAEGPRHGYAIMREVEQQTGGEVRLGPGTLYTALRRMLDRGLVEEGSVDGPARRVGYRMAPLGRDVVVAEVARMQACVQMASASALGRLLPGT